MGGKTRRWSRILGCVAEGGSVALVTWVPPLVSPAVVIGWLKKSETRLHFSGLVKPANHHRRRHQWRHVLRHQSDTVAFCDASQNTAPGFVCRHGVLCSGDVGPLLRDVTKLCVIGKVPAEKYRRRRGSASNAYARQKWHLLAHLGSSLLCASTGQYAAPAFRAIRAHPRGTKLLRYRKGPS